MVPKKVFFTKGVGVHKERLASFELALRTAGLAHCNLVLVSSIYPPASKIIPKEEGLKLVRPGEIVFAVYARESNNEPNRLIAASVGLAIPTDSSMHGYLSEHHSFGETDERAGRYAEDLAASMLATTLGIEFNPALDWDEREHLFKMSAKIVRTSNITQSAVGNKDGLWTSVFAAAVFINEDNLPAIIGKAVEDGGLESQDLARSAEHRFKPSPHPEPAAHAYTKTVRHPQTGIYNKVYQKGAERTPIARGRRAVQDHQTANAPDRTRPQEMKPSLPVRDDSGVTKTNGPK
jgi:arginine decarboxylase